MMLTVPETIVVRTHDPDAVRDVDGAGERRGDGHADGRTSLMLTVSESIGVADAAAPTPSVMLGVAGPSS